MRSLISLSGFICSVFLAACGSSSGATSEAAGAAGMASASGGSGGAVAGSDSAGAGSGGLAATAGSGGSVQGGVSGAGPDTKLGGKLGALGDVQPTVSSLVISNSGETLIYLSSTPITCEMLKQSRWLGSIASASQVVEVVLKGAPKVGTVNVPPAEVNYAAGGKSSSYEVVAGSGAITFTTAEANGVVEGSLMAKYADGSTLMGTFHAEFCANGQGY